MVNNTKLERLLPRNPSGKRSSVRLRYSPQKPALSGLFLCLMFFVYIIYSQTPDRFYVGYTSDPDKRLQDHNSGLSSFTFKANDWELKFMQQFETRHAAMYKEKEIKSKKSRKYIEWLIAQK